MCMFSMGKPEKVYKKRVAKLTIDEAIEHLGGLENWFTKDGEELLREQAQDYIWKYQPTKGGQAYCTACDTEFEFDYFEGTGIRHNQEINCPACGKSVIFKYVGKGHKNVYDQFIFYEWQRSKLDQETMVLTAAHVWRNSTNAHPECAPLNVARCALYVFRPGHPATVYKRGIYDVKPLRPEDFTLIKECRPEEGKLGTYGTHPDIVVNGTWTIENCRIYRLMQELRRYAPSYQDLPLDAINNAARWPWLEYIAKSGQEKLAGEILAYGLPEGVNPRGRSVKDILCLTEGQWFEVRQKKLTLTRDVLNALRCLRRLGLENEKVEEAKRISRNLYAVGRVADELPKKLENVPDKLRRKIVRRVLADINHGVEWCDYFGELITLGEDMTNEALVLTRNLHEMHDRMSARVRALRQMERAEEQAEKQRDFREKYLKKLKDKYTFSARGLVLRPFETAKEIIDEGTIQRICIGSYVDRYMEGGTILCCLRRAEEPDEPWRAVEFTLKGEMVQDRGYRNDMGVGIDPGTKKLLRLFWSDFEKARKSA